MSKKIDSAAARQVAEDFEHRLRERIAASGTPAAAYHIEVTACGSAEGAAFAYRLDCVYLEQLTIPAGGSGTGGAIMRLLLTLADEMAVTVVLEAASQKFDERDPWWRERLSPAEIARQGWRFAVLAQEDLEAWYQRLGFTAVDADTALMCRAPGTPLPRLAAPATDRLATSTT